MLPVKLAHGLHSRPLLTAQLLSHLRPERRPVVGAHIGFESGRQQRAHGREHGFAAVHGNVRSWRGSQSWPGRRSWGRLLGSLSWRGSGLSLRRGLCPRQQRHCCACAQHQRYLPKNPGHVFVDVPAGTDALTSAHPADARSLLDHIESPRLLVNIQGDQAIRQGTLGAVTLEATPAYPSQHLPRAKASANSEDASVPRKGWFSRCVTIR
jgi:hypothetical protein